MKQGWTYPFSLNDSTDFKVNKIGPYQIWKKVGCYKWNSVIIYLRKILITNSVMRYSLYTLGWNIFWTRGFILLNEKLFPFFEREVNCEGMGKDKTTRLWKDRSSRPTIGSIRLMVDTLVPVYCWKESRGLGCRHSPLLLTSTLLKLRDLRYPLFIIRK